MVKRLLDNTKLGIFVLGGLLFLVLLLYMIGRNENLFGSTYELKVTFDNVQGLTAGNNVRVSGIEAGTVKKITIRNDTTIEVVMVIEKRMQSIIKKNAIVSIGTEGLVGNKVVNIIPARKNAPLAEEGDFLEAKKSVDTYEMIQTLSGTNRDIAAIAASLKLTVEKINASQGLWSLINDPTIPQNIKAAAANLRTATEKAASMANHLDEVVADVKNGKGSVGQLLTDTSFSNRLNTAITQINAVGREADSLANELNSLVAGVKEDINSGTGPAHLILKDSTSAAQLAGSLENIRKGTDGFNQNMEALKHNFLFRGFFRKQEKARKKQSGAGQ